jgi:hypothetical protein
VAELQTLIASGDRLQGPIRTFTAALPLPNTGRSLETTEGKRLFRRMATVVEPDLHDRFGVGQGSSRGHRGLGGAFATWMIVAQIRSAGGCPPRNQRKSNGPQSVRDGSSTFQDVSGLSFLPQARQVALMETLGKPVREWRNVTRDVFDADIVPLGQPAVLRGVVDAWPAVATGRGDARALAAYLATHDSGQPLSTCVGAPAIDGRFFYREDMNGFNFDRGTAPFQAVAELLLGDLDTGSGPAIYSGAASAADHFPTFAAANPMPLLDTAVTPRLWIGNAVTVSTHYDTADNIACVAAVS